MENRNVVHIQAPAPSTHGRRYIEFVFHEFFLRMEKRSEHRTYKEKANDGGRQVKKEVVWIGAVYIYKK